MLRAKYSIILGTPIIAIGLSTFFMWLFGSQIDQEEKLEYFRMAPSTAGIFLLLGIFILRKKSIPNILKKIIILFTIIVPGIILILNIAGFHSKYEHLGFTITQKIGESPGGYMSPLTAICFLLAGTSLLFIEIVNHVRFIFGFVATSCLFILQTMCFIFLLSYAFGAPIFYRGNIIPIALNTVITFIILGLYISILVTGKYGNILGIALNIFENRNSLILFFISISIGIVSFGFIYHRTYEKNFNLELEKQLSIISELKANELIQFRKERMGDASILYKNNSFYELAHRNLRHSDADSEKQIQNWFTKYHTVFQYDSILMLDSHAKLVQSIPKSRHLISQTTIDVAKVVLKERKIIFHDFHRDDYNGEIYLSIFVPIVNETVHSIPMGVVIFRIDPKIYLFPFLQKWPTLSQSGETLLVRKNGNNVQFLNFLKYHPNHDMSLQIPLTQTSVPVVIAISGKEGIIEGLDYRNVPVIVFARKIDNSPWVFIVKLDKAEAFLPLIQRKWYTMAVVLTLIAIVGGGLHTISRQHKLSYFKEKMEIAEQIRLISNALEVAANSIVITNKNGVIHWVNESFSKTTGYTREEAIGKTPGFLIKSGIQDSSFYEDIWDKILSGQVWSGEIINKRKDGTLFPEEMTITPLTDSKNQITHFVSVKQDITERKKAEEVIKNFYSELEEKVKTRTEELSIANKNLSVINKSLEVAMNDLKDLQRQLVLSENLSTLGKLAAGMTHELNTPLGAIISAAKTMSAIIQNKTDKITGDLTRLNEEEANNLKIILKESLDKSSLTSRIPPRSLKKDISEILKVSGMKNSSSIAESVIDTGVYDLKERLPFLLNTENSAQIMEAVSYFSSMKNLNRTICTASEKASYVVSVLKNYLYRESEDFKPTMEAVDLIREIENILPLYSNKIKNKVEIIKNFETSEKCLGDREKLNQVWINLINNALFAMNYKGILEIQTQKIGSWIILSIIDSGPGIPQEIQNKIFEPFFTTKKKGEGMGLGLDICSHIIKSMGGKIEFESVPGRTQFSVWLRPAIE